MYGVEKANEHGIDTVSVLLDLVNRVSGLWNNKDDEDIELGSPEMGEKLKKLFHQEDAHNLSVILWWGLLTFDDDVTLAEIKMMLTPGTLIRVVPKVVQKMMSFQDDVVETADAGDDDDDSGKASDGGK